jgi:hypothetical protein
VALRNEYPSASIDVIVDASFPFGLAPIERAAYDHEKQAWRVEESPAGTRADPIILAKAEPDAVVVSLDRYKDYREAFPWLHDTPSRVWAATLVNAAEWNWMFQPVRLTPQDIRGMPQQARPRMAKGQAEKARQQPPITNSNGVAVANPIDPSHPVKEVRERELPPEEPSSVRLYRKWAARGDPASMTNLGLIFDTRFSPIPGVVQDDNEAARWYRKAADRGYAQAQYLLGGMYEEGRDVLRDLDQAIELYRLAAAQGRESAVHALRRLGDSHAG